MRTQINCPQCRQMIPADIEQIFDLSTDPGAKQRLLSGQANVARCPHCGFNGALSTPLVYHDPSKELLLTFVPQELALPRNEQEKVIGGLINKVIDGLKPEQRKGYLFNPQSAFTFQGLVERVLAEDGITKEMIEGQQRRVNLIQRLAAIKDDEALANVVKEEEKDIDTEFFGLLSQLIQMTAAQGDEQGAKLLAGLQNRLLPITAAGRELQARSKEVEEVINALRSAGRELTREKLLELVTGAKSDVQIEAYASMARNGMDYQFYQLLSDKIEHTEGEEKTRLTGLRDKLLEISKEIEAQMKERVRLNRQNVELLLKAENLEQTVMQNLPAIDEYFLQALGIELEEAKKANNQERAQKLEEMAEVIQKVITAAAMGPGGALLEALLEAEDAEARKAIMQENAEEITPEFIESITTMMMQLEGNSDEEAKQIAAKVREVYREALRFSMKSQMHAKSE